MATVKEKVAGIKEMGERVEAGVAEIQRGIKEKVAGIKEMVKTVEAGVAEIQRGMQETEERFVKYAKEEFWG
ncbi:MAG: hypothetical protein WA977_06570 [Halobacteriota archaeon]